MKVTKKNVWTIIAFLLPAVAIYILLVVTPIVQSFTFSFLRWKTVTLTEYCGFDNFVEVFTDPIFIRSLKTSGIFVAGTCILQIVIGFILGYFVYQQLPGYRVYKTILFLPNVLAVVATGFIFNQILSPGFGLLKPFMELIGLGELYSPPLADPNAALFCLIFVQVWSSVGIQMMMFNSGFMSIPEDVLEGASIDGASGIKMITSMVIPLSWDVIKMIIILQLIGALRSFDLIYAMTMGGPNHATEVLPMYMFIEAFENMNIGHGTVAACTIFVLAMILTGTTRKLMARDSIY